MFFLLFCSLQETTSALMHMLSQDVGFGLDKSEMAVAAQVKDKDDGLSALFIHTFHCLCVILMLDFCASPTCRECD